MDVSVCMEVGPRVTSVFVPDCPGCWVFGKERQSAEHKVKDAVSVWYGWLKSHGEPVETPAAVRINPSEVLHVTYNPAKSGKPEPLFWSEVLPVSSADVERALRLMDYSRRDLMKLSTGLDNDTLRWKPKDEPRTVGNCLRHIAIAELWYISRLEIDLPTDLPVNTFELLRYTRELARRNLHNLSKEKRTLVFQPRNDPSPVCNLWTARKVLRRFVDHERLHTKYLERILPMNRHGA